MVVRLGLTLITWQRCGSALCHHAGIKERRARSDSGGFNLRACRRRRGVAHLRSDRRHIQDRDMERLRQNLMTKLNLEMGNTEAIIDIALRIKPEEVCLVRKNVKK